MTRISLKHALTIIMSVLILLPIIVVSASASTSSCTIASLTDYKTAAKALTIYTSKDVSGTNHSFGENVGSYKFDAKQKALSLTKSSVNYMGGYYRFHIKMAGSASLPKDQSWMVVSYKTNAETTAALTIASNGDASKKLTLMSDVSLSKNRWVYTSPVNISGAIMDRLCGGSHNALVVSLPKDTPDSIYFLINEIAFFSSKQDADNYVKKGIVPTPPPPAPNSPTKIDVVGTSSFKGSKYTYNGFTINASVWVPKSYSPNKEYALLIYFHNQGGAGNQPLYNNTNGNTLTQSIVRKYGDEVIIFAPRCPSGTVWMPRDHTGIYSHERAGASKPMDAAISYIKDVILTNYSIDTDRIYAVGDSLGGTAVWELMFREPELLAAAVPIAGCTDPAQAANIREDMNIWIIHTAQDKSINVYGDFTMYISLKNMGRNVRYTEYDTSNQDDVKLFGNSPAQSTNWEHWAWVPAYKSKELVDWLMTRRKDTSPRYAKKFADVDTSTPYYDAIMNIASKGYMSGTGAGTTFSPSDTMTRSMFVTVLGRIADVNVSAYRSPTFSDVAAGQWYTPYVEWAAANGIVNGYPDGRYGINDPITVQEALVILKRFAEKYAKTETNDPNTFLTSRRYNDGKNIVSWASEVIDWATSNGVYVGTVSNSRFLLNANTSASRGLVAYILYNYIEIFG